MHGLGQARADGSPMVLETTTELDVSRINYLAGFISLCFTG